MVQDPNSGERAQAFHPGKYLSLELQARNETHQNLAENLGCSEAELLQVLEGKLSVTPEMAFRLQRCWGISMSLLLDMQHNHDAAQATGRQNATHHNASENRSADS